MVANTSSTCQHEVVIERVIQKSITQRTLNYIKKIIIGPVVAFFFNQFRLSSRYKILNTNANAIGHLCIDVDCFLKESIAKNFQFRGVLLADRNLCSNVFLCKIWAKNPRLVIVESSLLCFLLDYLRTYPETSFDCSRYCALDGQPAEVYRVYGKHEHDDPVISWDQPLLNEASKLFNREFPGVDISKVVVLHSRDSLYDQAVQNENMYTQKYRNSYVGSFEKIVDFLHAMNYVVIRIGKYEHSSQMSKILTVKSRNLTRYEEQVLDVYLSSRCALFLGSASGASNLAVIWNVPVFLLNVLPYALLRPHASNSMALPKLLKLKGKVLSAKEIFQKSYHWLRTDDLYKEAGIEIKMNGSEECIDDFKEFFNAFVEKDIEMEAILKNSEAQNIYRKICPGNSYDYYASSLVPQNFLKKNLII